MIVSAHQPSYLAWLGYFHKVSLCDVFVYYDNVDHSKRDFTTRNKIKTSQGPMWLTVPVKKGPTKKIVDLSIDNKTAWQRRHLKGIQTCYGKSEYYDSYANRLEEFFQKSYGNFADMNFDLTKLLLELLGLRVEMLRSSQMGTTGAKNDGIYQMLEILGAKKIVLGVNGWDYVNLEEYRRRGIRCYFQDYKHPEYKQMFGEFSPFMSVVDLIFNCGPNSLAVIKSKNVLKSELFG